MARKEVRRGEVIERRWRTMRFISGGLLIGNAIEEYGDETIPQCGEQTDVVKAAEPEAEGAVMVKVDRKKKSKKWSKLCEESEQKLHVDIRRQNLRQVQDTETESTEPITLQKASIDLDGFFTAKERRSITQKPTKDEQKKADKEERRVRKAQRRAKREAKRQTKKAATANISTPASPPPSDVIQSIPTTAIGREKERTEGPRGISQIRRKYIQHKKMAMMDSRALNEVNV